MLLESCTYLPERTDETVIRAVLKSYICVIYLIISVITFFCVCMNSVFSFTSLTMRSKRTASDVFVDFDNLLKLELN